VVPVKNGTKAVAQVLTETVKHAEDRSNADSAYTNTFMNGVIDTESYIYLDIDDTEGDNGQIKIKHKSLFNVEIDPSCETYNLNDENEGVKYAIVTEWIDKQRMMILHEDALGDNVGLSNNPSDDDALRAYMCDEDDDSDYRDDNDRDEVLRSYRFCVKTVWWKEAIKGLIVKDRMTGVSRIISEDNEAYKRFKSSKLERFTVKKHYAYRLHKTTVVNKQILADDINPYGDSITDIPIFRYSPYWNEGYAGGQLDDITSLNQEENIHRTQTVKILNSTANSGFIIKRAINAAKRKLLANFGSVEGVVLEEDDYGGKIEKIAPNRFPNGIFAMGQQFAQDSKAISGIDDATMGIDTGKAESGRAINLRQQQNQVSAEITFNNFFSTMELVGQYLVDMIRLLDFYTDEEILSVITESPLVDKDLMMRVQAKLEAKIGTGLPEPQPLAPIGPEMMQMLKPDDKMRLIQTVQDGTEAAAKYNKMYPMMKKNYDDMIKHMAAKELIGQLRSGNLGLYGVKVTTSPTAPTERMLRFMELDSIASKYPGMIPPDILIDATNLSNKDEIKDRINQSQQMQQQVSAQNTGAA